jgi:Chromo (CHRromatin Organisation MOdifier) domain
VSQLKKYRGNVLKTTVPLLVFSPGGKLRLELTAILDRRIIKRKNQAVVEVFVKWSNLDDEEATWEKYESLCAQIPYAKLEDKLSLKDGK